MRRSKKDENEEEEKVTEEYHWDIKRIFIGLTALLILLSVAYYAFGAFERQNNPLSDKATLGVEKSNISSQDSPPLPQKDKIEQIITNAQDTLSKITSDNLTSSQAAVQKVISDLQELQSQKKQPVDIFCEYVCKNK